MKTSKIFLPLAAAGLMFTACNELDILPNGSYVTLEQKQEAIEFTPDLASAGVNSLPDQVNTYGSIFGNHIDFGIPSTMISLDSRGMDMVSPLIGYNWYGPSLQYTDFDGRYFMNLMNWYYNFYTIRTANSLLGSVVESENPELQYFRAQAYAFRAFSYLNMAQVYAFTYAKDPEALCLPIVTELNADTAPTEGCARSTVKEVYAQIVSDLDNAIRLLESSEAAGVTRYTMSETPALAKSFINSTTAYGLRARANLFRCDYPAAAADAQKAIDLATKEGLRPYTKEEVSVPAFTKNTDPSYVWGNNNDPSKSQFKGLVNYASHVTGFQTNGYAAGGVYRCVSKVLYNYIPSSDVRKKWWLDGSAKAPASLPAEYANFIKTGYKDAGNAEFPPYAQLKFGNYENKPQTNGAIDQPFLRVEELYMILAEAQGLQAPATGAKTLTDFVKTYRDPSYKCTASTIDDFRKEIWMQRRVEFWGEGFAYWDLQRFQYTVDRRGAGYDPSVVYVIAADDPVRLFDIPESEMQRNQLMDKGGNHNAVKPTPVEDVE